jgi:hypothetical protein
MTQLLRIEFVSAKLPNAGSLAYFFEDGVYQWRFSGTDYTRSLTVYLDLLGRLTKATSEAMSVVLRTCRVSWRVIQTSDYKPSAKMHGKVSDNRT